MKNKIRLLQDLIQQAKEEQDDVIDISIKANEYLSFFFQNSHLDSGQLSYYFHKAYEVLTNWKKIVPEFISNGMLGEEEFSINQKNLAKSFLENDDPFLEACMLFEIVTHLSSPKVSYFGYADSQSPKAIQQCVNEIEHIIKCSTEMLSAYLSLKQGYITLGKYSIYPGPYNIIPDPKKWSVDTAEDLVGIIEWFEEELDLIQNTNVVRFANGVEQEYPNTHKSKHNDFLKYLLLHLRRLLSSYFDTALETVVPILIPLAKNLNIISDKYSDFNRKLIAINSRNHKIDHYFQQNYLNILAKIPPHLQKDKTDNLLKKLKK